MKLNLRPKHHNHTQNRANSLATQNFPLSPYSGALYIQFAPSPFYKFVSLALMVLYQLESLNLDDYNLTYSQNKKIGVLKIFDNNPFETSSFPLYKNSSKPIQTNQNNEKQPQIELKPSKNTLHKTRVFL